MAPAPFASAVNAPTPIRPASPKAVPEAPLPPDDAPIWGFTRDAESLNGRLAMFGFALSVLIESLSGEGILHFLNLI